MDNFNKKVNFALALAFDKMLWFVEHYDFDDLSF